MSERRRSSRWRAWGATTALAAAAMALALPAQPAPAAPDTRPNIVFIVTDDQRWDTVWSMPTVSSELAGRGVTFSNGFVSNPLCCPSRASIFTGQYSHSTGVYTNKGRSSYGGFAAFDDHSTIATWLHDSGYRTGLFGKYINGYPGVYVPPGWDRWFATYDHKGYYGYRATTEDGVESSYGNEAADYGTSVIGQKAADFIRSAPRGHPFFAYVATHAPHNPATPAPGDEGAFDDLPRWRPPAYDEADVGDKPQYIQERARIDHSDAAAIDVFRADQYRSLLAVDRAVANVLDAVADTGRLSQTLIVFTSDNGLLWGEHRWERKSVPYEESIRVPYVVRYDPLVSRARTDARLVVNIDMAPTAADLAGVDAPGAEGDSLIPLLRSASGRWRSDFLIEHMSEGRGSGPPTYCGVRSESATYVYYETGEEELYDLRRDPDQLSNLMAAGAGAAGSELLDSMRERLTDLCSPAPPGLRLPRWRR
jgi:N-acetylglucosamine-6-sulfatase